MKVLSLLSNHPVPLLLSRVRSELSAAFGAGAARVGRAPAVLDVMGGIVEETGGITCSIALDRPAATVLLQPRTDGQLQIFSFDELDAHRPFTLCMPMHAFALVDEITLRANLAEPGRQWAWPAVGALWQLRTMNLVDETVAAAGINVALLNTLPRRAGLAASAALAAATVAVLIGALAPLASQETLARSRIGQDAERSMQGRTTPLGRHVTAATARSDGIARWQADTQAVLPPLQVPAGMRLVAIDTKVEISLADNRFQQARVAAYMAHDLILKKMRDMGTAAGRELLADPTGGFLARLDPNDYKKWFRPYLPEKLNGADFIESMQGNVCCEEVEEKLDYPVRGVADHHVLEARRVQNFVRFIDEANQLPVDAPKRGVALDKAGHLMYASHQSLSGDAALGVAQADTVVRLVRQREREGLYGARLTASGRGGVVAVLCEDNERATAALAEVLMTYADQTGLAPASYRTASVDSIVGGTTLLHLE